MRPWSDVLDVAVDNAWTSPNAKPRGVSPSVDESSRGMLGQPKLAGGVLDRVELVSEN
jgi:hypothetical protein